MHLHALATRRGEKSRLDAQRPASAEPMKKTSKKRPTRRSMRGEYDFSGGVRGKYAKRFAQGTNVVLSPPTSPPTSRPLER